MNQVVASGSSAKTRVYLDQNVLSHIARTPGDWRDNEYARALLDRVDSADVWISPTHVVELTLCPDLEFRQRLAEVTIALCVGRRMMRDYGTLLAHGFVAHVERACTGSISSRSYLDYYDDTLKLVFMGALALMATGRDPNPAIVESLTRWKLENRWLRAEAGKDPHQWVLSVKDCAKNLRLTPDPPRPELPNKSTSVLVAEIRDFEAQARRIDRKDRIAVDKERAIFARAYGVGDVFGALGATFGQLPGDLVLTFNFPHLAAEWSSVSAKLKCRPLPNEPAPDQHALWMLEELTRSLWHHDNGGVSAAMLAQEVMLRDYVDRLNETERERAERIEREGGGLPTDSLTFDADHAALALSQADVFVTRDQVLLNSCKTLASAWAERLKWKCQPVFTPEQLRKSLAP